LASLWSFGIPYLAYQISGNTFVSGTCFWMAWLLFITYFLLIGVYKVGVGAKGLRYWRGLHVRTIAWEEVEAIERVSRSDVLRLSFSASLLTGRIAARGSLTMTDYLRVRHKQGSLLFPPEDVAAFLDTVRAARTAHTGYSARADQAVGVAAAAAISGRTSGRDEIP
jgi:hypothetical protein